MRIKDPIKIYIRSMGKALRVTGIFPSDDDANVFMEKHQDDGVVAVVGDFIFTANLYDRGVKIHD